LVYEIEILKRIKLKHKKNTPKGKIYNILCLTLKIALYMVMSISFSIASKSKSKTPFYTRAFAHGFFFILSET
tara:strand:+ start:830 stop:1048 length:219 start_codon:yes stop_codon:yes gene_type:complete